jgi:hypothetical protein
MPGALHGGIGPNGLPVHISSIKGWMISPDRHHKKKLLYASDEGAGSINIYKLPALTLVGQITSGIVQPEGIATDKHGNLYVSNLSGDTVTVYKQGQTSAFLTLTETGGPDDVAVATNGYVFVGDISGGVDVYPPGATTPSTRLTNSAVSGGALGVAVDSHNNVYAAGVSTQQTPAVVEYANMSGSGTNLGLTGLENPTGVLVDNHGNLVVSDFVAGLVDIYAPGKTSPTSTITVPEADRTSINKGENTLYVPQGPVGNIDIVTYPGGSSTGMLSIGNFVSGTASAPAPDV